MTTDEARRKAAGILRGYGVPEDVVRIAVDGIEDASNGDPGQMIETAELYGDVYKGLHEEEGKESNG